MSILTATTTLNNGVLMPKLGFGTWEIPNDKAQIAVEQAIKTGYRHIDTAQAYQNERGVGLGIKAAGVDRKELFITTKLAAEIKDYEGAKQAIDQSLADLDVDYLDLLLIHSPKPWEHFYEDEHFFAGNLAAWKAMEEAYEAGKIRAIGVSNFEREDLDNLLENAKVKPMVDQILLHIGHTPQALIAYAKEKNIQVEAYSPIAHGVMLQHPELKGMADKYGVSIPQLAIRYCLELGSVPLPKTENPEHMAANARVDFEISDEDMTTLKQVASLDYDEFDQFPVFGITKR
ncbi:MAG: aldo/keto reductase [Aerococcus sp.]|nr:aldo/keto reductase [Aerococcus sp.]